VTEQAIKSPLENNNTLDVLTPSNDAELSRILVVDDEKVIREILADFLSLEGFDVATAPDGRAAIEQLESRKFNMVISDLKMPNMGGLELLEYIQKHQENLLTVIMTGFGTVETAIEAMKKGAYDYILKPFKVEEVVHIVHRGMEKQQLISENIRLKEVLSLHKLSEELQATLSLHEVIQSALSSLLRNLKCDAVGVVLKHKATGFYDIETRLHREGAAEALSEAVFNIDAIIAALRDNRAILAQKHEAQPFFSTPPAGLASFLAIPLVARQQLIGVMTAYSCTPGFYFTIGQRKLMNILGSRAAAAIDNAELYSGLQQSFSQTIQGFARALEAMDPYTAGHSDRVTLYAHLTAEEMGMPPTQIELIRQAGIMHDIGKLGCHANINKPGALTDEEFENVKLHPVFGKEILQPIEFLHPLIPAVYHHHERWDGKGYPDGLIGEKIPREARILSVADAYDAMTSDRAYRKALPHDAAIEELQRNAGTQFDPEAVQKFLVGIERYRQKSLSLGIPIPQ